MILLTSDQEQRCDQLYDSLKGLDAEQQDLHLEQLQSRREDAAILDLLRIMLSLPHAEALPLDPHVNPDPAQGEGEFADASTSPGSAYARGSDVPHRRGWRFVERLGGGGFAEVWLVENAVGMRQALKLCLASTPRREAVLLARRNAGQEAALLAQLQRELGDHPQFVAIHDINLDEEPYWIAMEAILGGTLADRLSADGRAMPWRTAVELMTEIAGGVAAAHAKRIVHRDLKPGNILFDERQRIRIADFGISKSLEAAAGTAGLTMKGYGTAGYVAPEQADREEADPADDVFSLGVILWQLLCGSPQRFPRRRAAEGLSADVPPELLALIDLCLDARERRPRDAGALAARLGEIGAKALVESPPPRPTAPVDGDASHGDGTPLRHAACEVGPARVGSTAAYELGADAPESTEMPRSVGQLSGHTVTPTLASGGPWRLAGWRSAIVGVLVTIIAWQTGQALIGRTSEPSSGVTDLHTDLLARAEVARRPRVAVLYFENLSPERDELQPLTRGLCSMMIDRLCDSGAYELVERARIEDVLHELALTRGVPFDPRSMARIGRMLGADWLLFGSYLDALGRFQLMARMVEVEHAIILFTAEAPGAREDFASLVGGLATALVRRDHEVRAAAGSDASMAAVSAWLSDSQPPADGLPPLDTALRFGRALDAADRGDSEGPRQLSALVSSAPQFRAARREAESRR